MTIIVRLVSINRVEDNTQTQEDSALGKRTEINKLLTARGFGTQYT